MTGVGITFFVDGERYAFRRWHAVPRKGDETMLRNSQGVKVPFKVLRVVWGVEADVDIDGQQANIEIREIKTT